MSLSQAHAALKSFFDKPVCSQAAAPLKDGVEIAIKIGTLETLTLKKQGGRLELFPSSSLSPDMTFSMGEQAGEALAAIQTEDIGEIGIMIFDLMIHPDKKNRISVKVHANSFSLLRNGYFGVLALGGAPVMTYLAKKGLGNISKIKNALSRLKD
jgi:hypothetical protein